MCGEAMWWCFECSKRVSFGHVREVLDLEGMAGTCKIVNRLVSLSLQTTVVRNGEIVHIGSGAVMGPELLAHERKDDAAK